ncbi:hypothetical protein [Yeosuana marina]|uniref:hypothetical protein n=1 Tax=Yeosuana marina TaxID=1565536 RepID=UPI0030C81DB5
MENIIKDDNREIVSKSNLLVNKLVYKNEDFDKFIQEISPQIDVDSIISFSECTFKLPAVFQGLNAKEISFDNCTFEKEFFLIDLKASNVWIKECTFKDEARIINLNCGIYTVIRGIKASLFRIDGQCKTLQFVSSKIEELKIGNINSEHSQKETAIEFLIENEIKKTKIEPYATFSHIVFKGSKYEDVFFEGTFNNRISFEKNVEIGSVFFESSNFDRRIDFQEGKFNYINFYRSNFNGLIYINDFEASDVSTRNLEIYTLWMHSCNFDKDVSVQTSKVEHITLSNNNFNQLLNFNQFTDEIDAESKLTMIRLNGVNRGSIFIERAYIDINLNGLNHGNIYLNNSNIYSLILSEFENKGSINLTNIKSGKFLTIQEANAGDIYFTNTDINCFDEIVIANSNIEKINFKSYPNKVLSFSSNPKVGYGIKDKSKDASNLKDVFNQLKQIAKRKGDVHIANKYQSLEHKQLLKSKLFGFDSILLFLNLISNKNGKSWSRGVLFTLVTAFLFYWIYISVLGLNINRADTWKEYILYISSFPKLSVGKYESLNSKWSVSLVIWLSRIFISYGIYQTVAAFRKYGKS